MMPHIGATKKILVREGYRNEQAVLTKEALANRSMASLTKSQSSCTGLSQGSAKCVLNYDAMHHFQSFRAGAEIEILVYAPRKATGGKHYCVDINGCRCP
jgi:hypothetical protein